MAAQHTPGPWKVFTVQSGPNKGQLLGVGMETGEGVTDAHGGLWGSGDEKMSNARLIAAAPDLLEALKLARVHVAASSETCTNPNTAILARVDAAILKALGLEENQ